MESSWKKLGLGSSKFKPNNKSDGTNGATDVTTERTWAYKRGGPRAGSSVQILLPTPDGEMPHNFICLRSTLEVLSKTDTLGRNTLLTHQLNPSTKLGSMNRSRALANAVKVASAQLQGNARIIAPERPH